MANVGIPYLESGESLILTTDRVSVNTVPYDVLLTTRFLILVDIRYAQFQPQMIPLLTIESVKGGKTANGELVITLFFSETGSGIKSDSMVLVFSQQPGENRKRERDDWLKTLMGLTVSLRQETSFDSVLPADPETGIRPSMKHSTAPEIPLPYTKVVETRPAQIELIIIPDEPESPVLSEEKQELPEMAFTGERKPFEVTPLQSAMEETPGTQQEVPEAQETLSPSPPVFEKTIDTWPEPTESTGSLSSPLPIFEEIIDSSPKPTESPDSLSLPDLLKNVEFSNVHEEESVSPDIVTLIETCEEIPLAMEADSGAQKSVPVSLIAAVKSLSSPSAGPHEPDTKLPPPCIEEIPVALAEGTVSPDALLRHEKQKIVVSLSATEEHAEPPLPPGPSTTDEKSVALPEEILSPDEPPSPEPVPPGSLSIHGQDFPITEPVPPEAGNGDASVQQPAPKTTPDAPGSSPPPAGPGSRRHALIAVAAVLLIVLGIAGMMVFYPQNQAAPVVEPPLFPTPTLQLTPQTAQLTPQTTAVIIPPTGVWVRVNYTRAYNGWVGIPGSLREVSGSGDQFFKIPVGEGIVQAQIYKPDSSGDTITVEIYRDGKVIGNRTTSTPRSTVELMIDAETGNPPGMTPVVTPTGNQTGSGSGRIMYF
jgi:hypothetical protein